MSGRPSDERLRHIEALCLDCDGVLTAGDILYDTAGGRLLAFNARDGMGLALVCREGLHVAILSGRPVDIAELRHRELGIEEFVGRCKDKAQGVLDLCERFGVSPEACAFVGDDLADLAAFRACGLSIAVANAAREVKAKADWITDAAGGHGAVREVCEALLAARGVWDRVIDQLG